MALAPKFKGQRLLFSTAPASTGAAPEPLHTVELFLDYVCPYSAKMFNTIHTTIAPAIRADPTLASRVQFLFRNQVQPWHPSSTLAHEASLAVLRLVPEKFWDFSAALFREQKAFFDVAVVGETRNETYKRLAALAAESVGVDADEVYKLLAIPVTAAEDGSLNVGNAVTNDLKVVVKMARLVGVHVSPTVIFDGVVANDVSSGWTLEQWLAWLGKNVA
ncbi:thioredoxin-like protein [Cercophora scortea]|uniref:Thioredoxin-like protein n=1 Tax=Cercophora scortea TaxID=314031 RepID=A0AAE0MKZ6_9PEZI|nr:thioredoxin-like protein [Cercophora scortea]